MYTEVGLVREFFPKKLHVLVNKVDRVTHKLRISFQYKNPFWSEYVVSTWFYVSLHLWSFNIDNFVPKGLTKRIYNEIEIPK